MANGPGDEVGATRNYTCKQFVADFSEENALKIVLQVTWLYWYGIKV